MKNLVQLGAFLILSFVLVSEAFGHARLVIPTPRSNRDNNKDLNLPCGPDLKGNNPTVYQPGQTINVRWEETINHAGYFELFFSESNDANFIAIPNTRVIDNQNGGFFNLQVTLPNVECETCTLRMIQFMNDDPNQPYQSCSDIALRANNNGGGGDGGGGGGGQQDLSSSSPSEEAKPGFGCGSGTIGVSGGSNGTGSGMALLALPFLVLMLVRNRQFARQTIRR